MADSWRDDEAIRVELHGKVAIVTGSARGMGSSHARILAEAGASVLLCDVLEKEGRATTDELAADGLNAQFFPLDVTMEDEWDAAVQRAIGGFGGVDVLINNAGVSFVAPVDEVSVDHWRSVMAVSATGTFLGMRAVVSAMRARGAGSIVNVAAVYGLRGAPQYIADCTSKGAVLGMTRAAALALVADKIRVNAVCPGSVITEMSRGATRVLNRTPLGRRAVAREISEGVLFLASARSSYMTGTEIVMDGGFLLT